MANKNMPLEDVIMRKRILDAINHIDLVIPNAQMEEELTPTEWATGLTNSLLDARDRLGHLWTNLQGRRRSP